MATQNDIRQTVEKLIARDGLCSAEAFVAEAEHDDSPVHDMFEWDDATEAHRWRVHKARTIIVSVKLDNADKRTPAFVPVVIERDGKRHNGYIGTETALTDAEQRDYIFHAAAAGLAGWRRRLDGFHEAADAVSAIDSAIAALTPNDTKGKKTA